MTRMFLAAVALGLAACASRPQPVHMEREHVTKHFVVVVEEPDPLAPEEERGASIVTRPVAGGPLGRASDHETAFASRDPRFAVQIAWRGDCLDVSVARRGLAPFDDFDAHGCIVPEGPATKVATVTGASGAPIDVVVWVLDQS